MSGQDGTEATTKPRRNRQASTQKTTLQRPANDDEEAWKAYWKAQAQPWRAKLEIDVERQKDFDERRNITSDIEKGVYPFKDIDPKRLCCKNSGRDAMDVKAHLPVQLKLPLQTGGR